MPQVPEDIMELGAEIHREHGQREELLRYKCRWEAMSRPAVLMAYGDPATWPGYDPEEE